MPCQLQQVQKRSGSPWCNMEDFLGCRGNSSGCACIDSGGGRLHYARELTWQSSMTSSTDRLDESLILRCTSYPDRAVHRNPVHLCSHPLSLGRVSSPSPFVADGHLQLHTTALVANFPVGRQSRSVSGEDEDSGMSGELFRTLDSNMSAHPAVLAGRKDAMSLLHGASTAPAKIPVSESFQQQYLDSR